MESFVYLAKSIGILSLFYVLYYIVLKRNTLFTAKRHYLVAGVIAALALPFIEFTRTTYVAPPTPSTEINPGNLTMVDFQNTMPVESVFVIDWWQVASIIYLVGLAFMLVTIFIQLLSIWSLIKSGTIIGKNKYTYVAIKDTISPFSFFGYIVYNPNLHAQEELEMILAHEQVHARQWHTLDIMITQLTLALQWCNPLAWLYKHSLEQNLEHIADSEAIQQINNPQQYQRTLVKVSSPTYRLALTNQFYKSFIKNRIVMLNKPQTRKHNLWQLGLILPLLALFMYSFNVREVVKLKDAPNVISNSAFAKAGLPSTTVTSFIINEKTTAVLFSKIQSYFLNNHSDAQIDFRSVERNPEGELVGYKVFSKINNRHSWRHVVTLSGKANIKQGIRVSYQDGPTIVLKELGPKGITMRETSKGLLVDTRQRNIMDPKTDSIRFTENVVNRDSILVGDDIIIQNSDFNKSTDFQDIYNFKITKKTTIEELETLKLMLKKTHEATFKYSRIDFNASGEITSIRLDFKDANGNNKNYVIQSDSPIADIFIYRNADGSTGMGNAGLRKEVEELMEERIEKMKIKQEEMRLRGTAQLEVAKKRRDSMQTEMRSRRDSLQTSLRFSSSDSTRTSVVQRQNEMGSQMKVQRKEMEERRLAGKARLEERREEIEVRREEMKQARTKLEKIQEGNDSGSLRLKNGDTYYFIIKNGKTEFYDRFGDKIKEEGKIHKQLRESLTGK